MVTGEGGISSKLLSLALPKCCGKMENRPTEQAPDCLHTKCSRKLPEQAKNTWDFASKEYLRDFMSAGLVSC